MRSSDFLSVSNLQKRYASVKAVDGVSFTLPRREVFALLGPNGAGKSTVLRMLLGLAEPDAGSIVYQLPAGPSRHAPPRDVGYLPEERGLYQDIEILRTLGYFGHLRGMSRKAARDAALHWLERLGLAARAREPLKALSKGNQQKVQLISALLHAPAFVVLDEPFSGLDPVNQEVMLELIQEMRDKGVTVLLSAHQMQLVERVADRVMVMNRGQTLLNGALADLRRQWATGSRLILQVEGEPDLAFMARHAPRASARLVADSRIEILIEDGFPLGRVLIDVAANLNVRGIETQPVTLHEVYVRAVRAATPSDLEQEAARA